MPGTVSRRRCGSTRDLTIVPAPEDERAAWMARLLGVLEGTRAGDNTSAIYVDRRGRRLGLDRDDQGGATLTELATGAELPYSARHLSLDGRFDWFASNGLTSRAASDLIVVAAGAFTADKRYDPEELEAKLKAARARLARVEKQHQSALTRSRRRDDLCRRIAELDEQRAREEAALARRRHADAAAAVQRLETELALSQGLVPPDRTEADAVLAAAGAADDWWRTMGAVSDAQRAFGSRARLDRDALTLASARPVHGADELEPLAKACLAMAERRDELVARLDAGVAAEVDETAAELRRELIEAVEPAYVDTLAALAAACRPFGVTVDAARIETAGIGAPGMEALGAEVLAEVAAQVAGAEVARVQQALEDAEADCRAARERLAHQLSVLGLPTGGTPDLAAGAEAMAARAADAAALLATPLVCRPLQVVEPDLEAARAVLTDCPPLPSPADGDTPAVAATSGDDPPIPDARRLMAERTRLAQALQRVERNLSDIAPLTEKLSVVEHEVAALEASLSAGRRLMSASEAEIVLLRRATEAGRNDRRREPLPLVVDDAIAPFGASDKRRLLDAIARLSETTQIVYLTDDPETLAWTSGRDASDETGLTQALVDGNAGAHA